MAITITLFWRCFRAQNKQPLPLREIRLDPAILAKRKKIQAELQAQNKRDKVAGKGKSKGKST